MFESFPDQHSNRTLGENFVGYSNMRRDEALQRLTPMTTYWMSV